MNCRSAQRLMSSERDGALPAAERADLAAHVAACASCQRARASVAAAVDEWRSSSARIAVPDVERAWQDIRREIRTSAPSKARTWWGLPRWTLPLAAAAGLIVAATVMVPPWLAPSEPPQKTARLETARADFVEVANNSSSVVYVDDKSGWLVVWAVNDKM